GPGGDVPDRLPPGRRRPTPGHRGDRPRRHFGGTSGPAAALAGRPGRLTPPPDPAGLGAGRRRWLSTYRPVATGLPTGLEADGTAGQPVDVGVGPADLVDQAVG